MMPSEGSETTLARHRRRPAGVDRRVHFCASSVSNSVTASTHRSLWRRASPVAASLVVGGLLTSAAMQFGGSRNSVQVTRLSLTTSGAAALSESGNYRNVAITPDGLRVVYVGDSGRQLSVRALDQVEPVVLATGSVVRSPFISPDGQWVGFEEGINTLKKVPIAGGPAITVTEIDGIMRGATWLPDNTIVFATNIARPACSAIGRRGMPTQLTTPDAANHETSNVCPRRSLVGPLSFTDHRHGTGGLGRKVTIQDLQADQSTDLFSGGTRRWTCLPYHLVYSCRRRPVGHSLSPPAPASHVDRGADPERDAHHRDRRRRLRCRRMARWCTAMAPATPRLPGR